MDETNELFLNEAIRLANENIDKGGGPFGAVIVKNGEIIATGVNSVTSNNDPTAHAEVQAIRNASKKLDSFNLAGCEIYSSCEPCPMCLGAIYWARLDRVYYAADKNDAKSAGFDDSYIYKEMDLPVDKRKIPFRHALRKEAVRVFKKWKDTPDKKAY